MPDFVPDPDTSLATLPNGVRLVAIALPQLATVSVSVFVRSGSQHESRRQNGISHFAEHMAFKGTATRDCQRINLDAERLGAECECPHRQGPHGLPHDRPGQRRGGLHPHAGRHRAELHLAPRPSWSASARSSCRRWPRTRTTPLSTAFKLFDTCCWGEHAVARPVIGSRRNIERFTREELLGYVRRQYTEGQRWVVGVAGAVDPQRLLKVVEEVFGAMPAGPAQRGGRRRCTRGASARAGWPAAARPMRRWVFQCLPSRSSRWISPWPQRSSAKAMSSPLMDEIRERRGLVYYAACSADVQPLCGQFVIEASMGPEHLGEYFAEGAAPAASSGRAHPAGGPGARAQPAGGAQPACPGTCRPPAGVGRAGPLRARPRAFAGRVAGPHAGGGRRAVCAAPSRAHAAGAGRGGGWRASCPMGLAEALAARFASPLSPG